MLVESIHLGLGSWLEGYTYRRCLARSGSCMHYRNPTFAECWRLCRVQDIEHSAKIQFDECLPKATRQKFNTRQRLALPSAWLQTLGKPTFAECHAGSTRHTASRVRRKLPPRPLPVTAVIVCRVPARGHSANTSLPSATHRALGKDYHVRRTRPYPVATNGTPLRRPLPL